MREGGPTVQRLLGVFAHPDDEVFCAGGTIADRVDAGASARILSLTRGGAGRISHVNLATRATLGSVRAAELAAAGAVLGAEAYCLDFPDGGLAEVERDRLVQATVDQIMDFEPDTVISFDETGAYGHPDHIVACEVAVEACKAVEAAGAANVPKQLLQATFPQRNQLLIGLIVDWLAELPERFKGTAAFVNAMLVFADSSTMLGFASDHLRIEWFPAGSFIVEQGEPADNLYLLLSGEVEVRQEDDRGGLKTIGTVDVGGFLGEVGLATGARRNAHCIAASDCAAFVLSPGGETLWKPRGGADDELTPPATAANAGHGTVATSEAEPRCDLRVDVSHLVDRKFQALTQHRSQYLIEPGLFPPAMLSELLGEETFIEGWRSATDNAGAGNTPEGST